MLTSKYPTTQKTPQEFADKNGLSDLFIQKTDQVSRKWGLFGSKGGSKKRKTNKQKSKKRNAKKNKSKRRV